METFSKNFKKGFLLLLVVSLPFSLMAQTSEETTKSSEERLADLEKVLDNLSISGRLDYWGWYHHNDLPQSDTGGNQLCPMDPAIRLLKIHEYVSKGIDPEVQGPIDYNNWDVTSPCKTVDNYHTFRVRPYFKYTGVDYADLILNFEIGYFTAGLNRDDGKIGGEVPYGPGSGGKHNGSGGAVNVETREMYVDFHNSDRSKSFDLGQFKWDMTPDSFHYRDATGIRYNQEFKDLNSDLEFVWVRADEDSLDDDDGNGFNDGDDKDLDQYGISFSNSSVKGMKFQVWDVYQEDNTTMNEHSQFHWLGLYFDFDFNDMGMGPFGLDLHYILNKGSYNRPWSAELTESNMMNKIMDSYATANFGDTVYNLAAAYIDPLEACCEHSARKNVDANALHVNFDWKLMGGGEGEDSLDLTLSHRTRSGRQGDDIEFDGMPGSSRSDQFHYTNGTDYANVSEFADWSLLYKNAQGINEQSVQLAYSFGDYTLTFMYFIINLNSAPNLAYNKNYVGMGPFEMTEILDTVLSGGAFDPTTAMTDYINNGGNILNFGNSASTHYGNEINIAFDWSITSSLSLSMLYSNFVAGEGYKGLMDVEYGSTLSELYWILTQRF